MFLAAQQPLMEKRKKAENMEGIIYSPSSEDYTFGKGYQHDSWLVKDKVNELLMEARRLEKVVAFKYMPYVFVYEGQDIKYKAKVKSFEMTEFLYDGERGALSVNKSNEWSEVISIKETSKNEYLVSVRNMKNASEQLVKSTRTYYINTEQKSFLRENKYSADISPIFEPINTRERTLYYKSGRIYDKRD
ncbi:MAG: hypothetical protein BRD35_03160 [Bacteroidetes bacterium QH_7_62_13]|nr:MAG: hypothetical protein BRD35_03160 [Bacteroidetes bacterium QH_7_62_13]